MWALLASAALLAPARLTSDAQVGPPAWAKGLDLATDLRPVNRRGVPNADPALIASHPRLPSSFLVTSKSDPFPDAAFGDRMTAGDLARGELAARGKLGVTYYKFALPKGASKLLAVTDAGTVRGWVLKLSDDDGAWFVSHFGRLRGLYGSPCAVGWNDGGYRAVWTFTEQRLVGRMPQEAPSAQIVLDWKPGQGDHADTIAASA